LTTSVNRLFFWEHLDYTLAMQKSQYIWMNGNFIDWDAAQTHVLTHALHYGSGVFEGIRAYETPKGPAIFKAEAHYKRLLESCDAYYMVCPYSVDTFIQTSIELIQKNNLPACYLRPLVYTDYGSIGIIPKDNPISTFIAAWEWGSYLGDDGLKNGIRCVISDIKKTPSAAMPSTAKSCANYANSFLAKRHALNAGYDEAILLNMDGFIAEGPGENIFVIKNGKIKTPPIVDDVLKGITRDTVIALAKDLDYEVIEDSVTLTELLSADECFFTGTAAEVTPIKEINNHSIGNGGMGAITQEIQALYFNIVKGLDSKYQDWLTYC
jgi:branched-chain amino acid aminotransferase